MASSKCGFSELPAEMVTRVFSYLSPLDLTRCARVSKHWNVLAYSPDLWRRVYPTNWGKGLDEFIPHDPLNDDNEDAFTASSSSPFDDNYFVDQNDSEGPPTSQAEKEVKFYQKYELKTFLLLLKLKFHIYVLVSSDMVWFEWETESSI